jgi:hypothetical protein
MKYYRYKTKYIGDYRTPVELVVYEIYKETEKGFWIVPVDDFYPIDKHFILKKPGRKKYAYPTKKEALTNYILRTEKYKKILEDSLHHCKQGLEFALKINIDE